MMVGVGEEEALDLHVLAVLKRLLQVPRAQATQALHQFVQLVEAFPCPQFVQ
jgi:hypothetical protein